MMAELGRFRRTPVTRGKVRVVFQGNMNAALRTGADRDELLHSLAACRARYAAGDTLAVWSAIRVLDMLYGEGDDVTVPRWVWDYLAEGAARLWQLECEVIGDDPGTKLQDRQMTAEDATALVAAAIGLATGRQGKGANAFEKSRQGVRGDIALRMKDSGHEPEVIANAAGLPYQTGNPDSDRALRKLLALGRKRRGDKPGK
jgi:hypothetical protein